MYKITIYTYTHTYIYIYKKIVVEGSLEVKLPTNGQMKSTARKNQSQEETLTWRKSEVRR